MHWQRPLALAARVGLAIQLAEQPKQAERKRKQGQVLRDPIHPARIRVRGALGSDLRPLDLQLIDVAIDARFLVPLVAEPKRLRDTSEIEVCPVGPSAAHGVRAKPLAPVLTTQFTQAAYAV